MFESAKGAARRSDRLRAMVHSARRLRVQVGDARGRVNLLRGRPLFENAPAPTAIRLAYEILLDRRPDQLGQETFSRRLAASMTRRQMVDSIIGSDEFALHMFRELGPSLHFSRGVFVRSLPPGRRILDLGGSSSLNKAGALVSFGYPYPFEELVIVELPADERHAHYRGVIEGDRLETHLGPVTFRYHSMTDLGGLADGSFDLIYSGQSIEHVTEDEADKVLVEARRVLRPGGILAIDTPNGPVCRLRQAAFIDPDHKVEYSHAEFSVKLEAAGFRILRAHGLNHAGNSVEAGRFDMADVARHWGLFDDIERCDLLAYVCTPAT
jgi:SAM-dependent methyltransferase